jgi:hypothetical protein
MEYTVGAGLPAGVTDALTAGQCFWYNTLLGGVTGAAVTTNNLPCIWNPSDSNRMLHILQINYGVVSGTVIAAHIAYGYLLGAGAQKGTAQPIITYANVVPVNAMPGAGVQSRINFSNATLTMTTGPAYLAPNGFSSGGALAAGALFSLVDEVWGKILVPPGVAFFPYVSNGAIALVASVSTFGWEQVINPNGP